MGGVLLGGTVGIGIWRAVAVDRAVSARPSPWVPAAGVAVGLVLGQVVSLANTTTGLQGGLGQAAWLIVPALAGLAATALVYSLAEVSADAASRLRSPLWAWMPGVVVASLVYFAALYLSFSLQLALDVGNWAFTRRTSRGSGRHGLGELGNGRCCCHDCAAVVFKRGRTWRRRGYSTTSVLSSRGRPRRDDRPAAAGRVGLRRYAPSSPTRCIESRRRRAHGAPRNRLARGDDVVRRYRGRGGGPCVDRVRPSPVASRSQQSPGRSQSCTFMVGFVASTSSKPGPTTSSSLRRSRRTSSASRSCWSPRSRHWH